MKKMTMTALQEFNLLLAKIHLNHDVRCKLFDLANEIEEEAFARGYDDGHDIGYSKAVQQDDSYEYLR